MRLLIINFEMNDESGVLAWQAAVARELARHCEFVLVLTERLGTFTPPPNMRVELIPKRPAGIPGRLGSRWLVNAQSLRLCRRHKIDACFIHMASEWCYYLSPSLRHLRIPILVWFAHGTVTPMLHKIHRRATRIVTSTPEGFRIPSGKTYIIGQGVDTDLFTIPERTAQRSDLIYIGRVSRRKRINLLVKTMDALRKIKPDTSIRLRIVGPRLTPDDHSYDAELRTLCQSLHLDDYVNFAGFVSQKSLPPFYTTTFLHINVSHTGSMDKTVVEALACGCPVLTANEALFDLLKDYPEFIIHDERPEAIAEQALQLYERRDSYDPAALRALVVGKHDLHSYAKKIVSHLQELIS